MKLVSWKPVCDTPAFADDVGRMFDDMWRTARRPGTDSWYPTVDLAENENEFKIVAELPGMAQDSVKITLEDNIVTLKGEKQAESESSTHNWLHVERNYGSFERRFRLGTPVEKSKVSARFDNGILTIVLPKSEQARPREISIDS